jgi:cell division protein FtsQ
MIESFAALRGARSIRLPRPRPRVLLALALVLMLLLGLWLWVRDSSLVAVNRVAVTGASGPDAAQVRHALELAARNMTTLDVHMDQLHTAVAPFPVVKALRVTTQFPHGMRIQVLEQIPVAAVVVDGRRIAVAGDGTLLRDVTAAQGLAVVPLGVAPGGSRLTDNDALGAVNVLAGAPYPLLARVSKVISTPPHGLVATLRNGLRVYFGDSSRIAAKWAALAAVLADPGSAGAAYIDVTDPDRPAAGGVGPTTPTSSSSSGGTTGTGGSSSGGTAGTATGAASTGG